MVVHCLHAWSAYILKYFAAVSCVRRFEGVFYLTDGWRSNLLIAHSAMSAEDDVEKGTNKHTNVFIFAFHTYLFYLCVSHGLFCGSPSTACLPAIRLSSRHNQPALSSLPFFTLHLNYNSVVVIFSSEKRVILIER